MSKLNKVASPLALAFALAAAPAMLSAQETMGPADPAVPGQSGPPPPGAPETMPQPGTTNVPPSDAPAPQAQQPTSGERVAAFVDEQFPQADADGNGSLSMTEFSAWIAKIKTAQLQATGQPVDDAEVRTYASNAFVAADKDADKQVARAELTQFLSQG